MMPSNTVAASRRAAVSLLFALAIVPIMMLVGLAIDFGFYNEAQSQLDMAADAAAMHAARIAALLDQQGEGNYLAKGIAAGQAWFAAQEGTVPQVNKGDVSLSVLVTLTSDKAIQAQVNYTGWVQTHFARLFPANWSGWPNWGVAGTSIAVISIPRFTEVQMLLDNSSSMLIAATPSDINLMESVTPCSQQAGNTFDWQSMEGSYAWVYNPAASGGQVNLPYSLYSTTAIPGAVNDSNGKIVYQPYGYGTFFYTTKVNGVTSVVSVADTIPTQPVANAACDSRFTGDSSECQSPNKILTRNGVSLVDSQGHCLNGYGGKGTEIAAPGTVIPATPNLTTMPQAPCAFACHDDLTGGTNDFYALAEASGVTLRYDVLQQAAANVISAMQTSGSATSLSVGVYQFNAPGTANSQPQGIAQVYPVPNNTAQQWYAGSEAGQDWSTAENVTSTVLPPRSANAPDTDFEGAMAQLAGHVAAAGDGKTPETPVKNLFIVTDGMDDYSASADPTNPNNANPDCGVGSDRKQCAIDANICNTFKNPVSQGGLGYTVYVLYIQYFPLPNPYYLGNTAAYVEPAVGSKVYNALQACASAPTKFYVARDGSAQSITHALKSMLAAAIGSAGRFSN